LERGLLPARGGEPGADLPQPARDDGLQRLVQRVLPVEDPADFRNR
jgi:hypothetical protein